MSNRDVAPRLRALDERVTKLEGAGMTDLEQKARDVAEECFEQCIGWVKSGYPGGMADPPNLTELIAQALRDVREADAQWVDVRAVNLRQRARDLEKTMARGGTVSSLLWLADELEQAAAAIRQGVK